MKESLESLKKAMKYVKDHPPVMDKEVQKGLKKLGYKERARCPKCKTVMQLISIDVDKIPRTNRFEVKHRFFCNKCRKPRFAKIGEYEE